MEVNKSINRQDEDRSSEDSNYVELLDEPGGAEVPDAPRFLGSRCTCCTDTVQYSVCGGVTGTCLVALVLLGLLSESVPFPDSGLQPNPHALPCPWTPNASQPADNSSGPLRMGSHVLPAWSISEGSTSNRRSVTSMIRRGAIIALQRAGLVELPPTPDPRQLPPPAVLVPEPTSVSLCWQPYPQGGPNVIYQVERTVWWNASSIGQEGGASAVSSVDADAQAAIIATVAATDADQVWKVRSSAPWQLSYLGNDTHATIQGLLPGTNVTMRVRWLNRTDTGPWSAPVPALIPHRGQCGNPRDMSSLRDHFSEFKPSVQACLALHMGNQPGALKCMEDGLDMSEGCASCWLGMGRCALSSCSMCVFVPVDPKLGPACNNCTETKCFPETVECTGVPRWRLPR